MIRGFLLVSEKYYTLTQRKYLYNIMPIANIESIIKNGILCYHKAKHISNHISIAIKKSDLENHTIMLIFLLSHFHLYVVVMVD